MRNLFLTLLMGFSILSHSQEKESDYFVFNKGGKKYLKPIKYILFDSKKDKKNIDNTNTYFYIKGRKFLFSKKNQKVDTCNIKFLKNIKFSNISNLEKEVYDFYIKKMKEDDYWKDKIKKHPMPIKINSYVKVILVSLENNSLIKYDVTWELSHPYH